MSKNVFTPDGGPHRPDRIRNVSDGLKRLGEFEAAEMLTNYAALLRERESAKAGVTEKMVERAITAWFDVQVDVSELDDAGTNTRMRAALEAVAPMLASQDQEPMHNDPRAESGDAEEIAQWLYANGYHVAAYTIRTQLDIRNKMLASARVPDETGWLIESTFVAPSHSWWAGIPEGFGQSFTTDANKAVRFCRKVDAEAVAKHMRRVIVTEHKWLAAAPKPETEE